MAGGLVGIVPARLLRGPGALVVDLACHVAGHVLAVESYADLDVALSVARGAGHELLTTSTESTYADSCASAVRPLEAVGRSRATRGHFPC